MKLFIQFSVVLILSSLSSFVSRAAVDNELKLTLEDFLTEAAKKHPELESAHWREEAAQAQTDISKSTILPSLEAGPLITRGEPGGSSVLGWNGNMSANLRTGQGFAGVVKYTAWDFGRTSASIRASTADVQFIQAETLRVKGEILLSLAQDYLECSRNKDLLVTLVPLKKQAGEISSTIEKLVKTGQRTPVEAHLARAQTLEIDTQIQIAQEKILFHEKKLGTMIGQSLVNCIGLGSVTLSDVQLPRGSGDHPAVISARARAKAADERLGFARAERNPRFQFYGNGGYFDSQNLNNPWNYSVSAALAIPIWDGKTGAEIRKSEAAQLQAEADLKAAELRIDSSLIAAEERYRVTEVQVHSLELERREAIQGFEIAKRRYQQSVGLLIDLRETVRNLIRVSTTFSIAQADFLGAQLLLKWYRGN